jgi:hypothetical protein
VATAALLILQGDLRAFARFSPSGCPLLGRPLHLGSDKTRPFYIELFGWTVDDPGPEYGGYVNFLKEGIPIAGSMRNDQAAVPDVWSVYLATDNAEATVSADDDKPEKVRASYGANLGRLRNVKAKYDPANLFRLNPNITPA